MILSKLEKPYSGTSLARIAVEVGEEEDIRRLVAAERERDYLYDCGVDVNVDWNEIYLSDLVFLGKFV